MKTFLKLIRSDAEQAGFCKGGKVSLARLALLCIFSRTLRVIFLVRLSQAGVILTQLSQYFLRKRFIEIGCIELGSHFFLPHPQSIIIAAGVKIGSHVHVGQYVTIGGNFKKTKTLPDGTVQNLPIVGDRVMIHPGAVIGGPVTIGNDVVIGANSVVTVDVPPNTIVVGQNNFSKKKISVPASGGCYEELPSL